MTWSTTVYRLPELPRVGCESPGCSDAAQFRFTASNGRECRTLDQCALCAEVTAGPLQCALPSKAAQVFVVPDAPRVAACRSCAGDIVWIRHPTTTRTMPVNPDGTSHHLSCPFADRHRKT